MSELVEVLFVCDFCLLFMISCCLFFNLRISNDLNSESVIFSCSERLSHWKAVACQQNQRFYKLNLVEQLLYYLSILNSSCTSLIFFFDSKFFYFEPFQNEHFHETAMHQKICFLGPHFLKLKFDFKLQLYLPCVHYFCFVNQKITFQKILCYF